MNNAKIAPLLLN